MTTLSAESRQAFAGAIDTARPELSKGTGPDDLGEHLYRNWYAVPVEPVDPPADLPDDLGSALRAAHAGGERWEDGWTVEQAGADGRIAVARNSDRRELDCGDYVNSDRPGVVPAPGANVLAPARRDLTDETGGWWFTHHETWRPDAPEAQLVRVYWSVDPTAAPVLVQELSSLFLDLGVPWMLKCALAPAAYGRADAAVLFVPRTELDRLQDPLDTARSALSGVLRDSAPPLTLRIGRGVAIADDPGTGQSFGEHRCRLIAEGLLTARASNGHLAAIHERFGEAGIPPDRPYAADETRRLPWE